MTDIDMGPFADPACWSHGSDTRADMFRLLRDEAPVLFMEDTVWPREGLLETYVERSGAHYASWMDTVVVTGNAVDPEGNVFQLREFAG